MRQSSVSPPHRSGPPVALWLPLAVWLALWPAIEAARAPLREFRPPTPVAVSGCCSAVAREAARDQAPGDQRHGCCADRTGTSTVPRCPEGGGARCAQCQSCGGPLLFALTLSMPAPERTLLGAVHAGDLVAASRDLRPPVPPPRGAVASLNS